MTALPLISIIIPTYNQRVDFLSVCIKSALDQTYANLEIVISDNHSTNPETLGAISRFAENKKVVVVKPDNHVSMIDNFVFAGSKGNGEYLSFLSSDDLLEPDAIQLLVDAILNDGESELAFGEIEYVEADSLKHIDFHRNFEFREGHHSADSLIAFLVNKRRTVWMNGNLINKKAYNEIGGIKTEHIIYAHDDAFLYKWLDKGKSITYVNKLLGKVRTWSDVAQKVEGNRDKSVVLDIVETYNMALNSKSMSTSFGYNNILEIRNKKLEEHALYWCVNYIKRKVSKKEWEEVRSIIYNQCKSLQTSFYFFCCRAPFKQIVYFVISAKNKFNAS